MATNGTETVDLFSDDELLKSIEELDRDLMKAMGEEASTGESQSESGSPEDESSEEETTLPPKSMKAKKSEAESETGTDESETGTGVAKGGALPMNQSGANGGAGELKAPGKALGKAEHKGHEKGEKVAKSFSDVATPEAQRTLDVTPFLAAQAETLDSLASAVNDLAKSIGGFGETDAVLSKSVVEIGRGLVDTRKQIADLNESLNEIRKGLRMPVRVAPKSTLAKSDAVERFETAAPSLSKAQTASLITDLVIKGDLDPTAVSAYEATGWMSRETEAAVTKEIEARYARR